MISSTRRSHGAPGNATSWWVTYSVAAMAAVAAVTIVGYGRLTAPNRSMNRLRAADRSIRYEAMIRQR